RDGCERAIRMHGVRGQRAGSGLADDQVSARIEAETERDWRRRRIGDWLGRQFAIVAHRKHVDVAAICLGGHNELVAFRRKSDLPGGIEKSLRASDRSQAE